MTNQEFVAQVELLNRLHSRIQVAKAVDPSLRVPYYSTSSGSILNAYREGDISFDDAVALLTVKEKTTVGATWRVGSKVAINVYEGNTPICQCQTVEQAARIVRAVNTETLCSTCAGDPRENEPDKDCICGGARTRQAEIAGLKAAITYWREKAEAR